MMKAVDVRFSKPTFVAIRCNFEKIEETVRRRNWYDLVGQTQWEETYTLFFRLKPEHAETNHGEHLLKENQDGSRP
jgi:hypothetical protein